MSNPQVEDSKHEKESLPLNEESEQSKELKYENIDIKNYSGSFNLYDENGNILNKIDLRNIKYKAPTEHLNCPICQQPFIEPLTTVCGHTFCRDCIHECFKMAHNIETKCKSGVCPLDRTPLDSKNSNDLFPTPLLIANLVDDLKVLCLNHERGCGWTGCRWELEHHVISKCPYTGVKCNGMKFLDEHKEEVCPLLVERRFIVGDKECVHELYQCKNCNQQVSRLSEEDHLSNSCLFNYQTCNLCSNDMIPLKNFTKHTENCIEIGHITCPAHEIGCNWTGVNDISLENHLSSCSLNQLLPSHKILNEKVDSLTKENQFLQRQINKILDSVIQGKITNLGYNESIEEIDRYSSFEDQDKLLYLNFELDRLKFEMEEKIVPFIQKSHSNERESIINSLVSDTFIMKEDLNLQRALINSLRKQLQFLLFARNNSRVKGFTDESSHEVFDISSKSNSEERLNLKL